MVDRAPTPRQLEVLRTIASETQAHGYAPTIRELAQLLGVTGLNGVRQLLDYLALRGLVTWVPQASRTLQLTPAAHRLLRRGA